MAAGFPGNGPPPTGSLYTGKQQPQIQYNLGGTSFAPGPAYSGLGGSGGNIVMSLIKRKALLDQILGQRPQQPTIQGYSTPTTPVSFPNPRSRDNIPVPQPIVPGGQPGTINPRSRGTPPSQPINFPDEILPPGAGNMNPYAGIAGFGNYNRIYSELVPMQQYFSLMNRKIGPGYAGYPTRERATQIGLADQALRGYQPFAPFGGGGQGLGQSSQDDLLRQLRLRAGLGA